MAFLNLPPVTCHTSLQIQLPLRPPLRRALHPSAHPFPPRPTFFVFTSLPRERRMREGGGQKEGKKETLPLTSICVQVPSPLRSMSAKTAETERTAPGAHPALTGRGRSPCCTRTDRLASSHDLKVDTETTREGHEGDRLRECPSRARAPRQSRSEPCARTPRALTAQRSAAQSVRPSVRPPGESAASAHPTQRGVKPRPFVRAPCGPCPAAPSRARLSALSPPPAARSPGTPAAGTGCESRVLSTRHG